MSYTEFYAAAAAGGYPSTMSWPTVYGYVADLLTDMCAVV